MREIKFRAWDKESKKMKEVSDISWDNHGGVDLRASCYSHDDSNIYAETLMQFTGLKDKNGKEMYEGDIVKCKYGWLGFIVFRKGAYWCEEIVTQKINSHAPIFNEWEELEVIGNIYENPELKEDS